MEPEYFLAADQINALVPADARVMLSFSPDIRFRYYLDRPSTRVTTLNAFETALAIDPTLSHYVFAPGSAIDESLRRHLVARYPLQSCGDYAVFDLENSGPAPLRREIEPASIPQAAQVRFGDRLTLIGFDWQPGTLVVGESVSWWEEHFDAHAELLPAHNIAIPLILYWQVDDDISVDLEVQIELVTPYGPMYTVEHRHLPLNGVYLTSMWGAGDVIRDSYPIELPADAPPLRYTLQLRVVDASTGEPLPVSSADDTLAVDGDRVTLGRLDLEPVDSVVGQNETAETQSGSGAGAGDGLILQSHRVRTADGTGSSARAGQQIEIGTTWTVHRVVDEDYPAWVELRGGQTRQDALLELAPTRLWQPGATYSRDGVLSLSPYLLPGSYSLDLVGGAEREQRIRLSDVRIEWAGDPRWMLDQEGTPDFDSADVDCLDTDRPTRLAFELDDPADLDVTVGWTGDSLVDEAWVEVYLRNPVDEERFLTTWTIPKGRYSVSSFHIPAKLTVEGTNVITLRVPEDRGRPRFLGWRGWLDAAFPDLFVEPGGPHDGWVCPDFVQVSSPWQGEWGAYRDLARAYVDLEMNPEALDLFDQAREQGLRPASLTDVNVFLTAAMSLDLPEATGRIESFLRSEIAHPLGVNLDGKIQVLGYALDRQGASNGLLTLYFEALQPVEHDYTIWLHQATEDADEYVSLDRRATTSSWQAGQVYQESWPVSLPSTSVRFTFGLWRWEDGSRLWVEGQPNQHEIDLGLIDLAQ